LLLAPQGRIKLDAQDEFRLSGFAVRLKTFVDHASFLIERIRGQLENLCLLFCFSPQSIVLISTTAGSPRSEPSSARDQLDHMNPVGKHQHFKTDERGENDAMFQGES